jgi:hypothetical protein
MKRDPDKSHFLNFLLHPVNPQITTSTNATFLDKQDRCAVRFMWGGSSWCCKDNWPTAWGGGFWLRLNHCGCRAITLLTVVICHIFSLEAADGESEICARPTATEAVRDPRRPARGCIDQQSRRLSWFLLVPGYIFTNVLTGLTGHSDPLSCRCSQGAWWLGHHDVPTGTCNQEWTMIIHTLKCGN